MTEPQTLTELVAEHVGRGRPMTFRAFEDRAVDPDSGYKPSRTTLHKISQGLPVMLSPELVRAVAAGLGIPEGRAQAAAALQYAGYRGIPVGNGVAVAGPDADGEGGLPKSQAFVDRWEAEEAERDDQ
ncbi:hypothetical protein AB0M28_13705 [Streptomyces sp. NPDC051940]|uniref:hypothetical protein n=1 Tax=Streptomyces sp. NPDC051940 TaxID=3155675 RepID=UPI0034365DCB